MESRTVAVLKACCASMIAPAIEEITRATISTSKLPYKDTNFWEVEVLTSRRGGCSVYHRKRQQAIHPTLNFTFEFELMVKFSHDFKALRNVSLFVTDLSFSPEYPALEEDKIRDAFSRYARTIDA